MKGGEGRFPLTFLSFPWASLTILHRCLHYFQWSEITYLWGFERTFCQNASFDSLLTFNVLIFYDAIGKIRVSKVSSAGEHFWRSDFTYGIKKDQNIERLLCWGTLLTFWFYLWCQKRSEHQKSNLTDFQCSDFWCSVLFHFRHSYCSNFIFNILTLRSSNFWRSDPLPWNPNLT